MNESTQEFLKELTLILGRRYVITDEIDQASYLTDWRKKYTGLALAVVLPKSTQQVSDIVKICQKYQISMVPQGGNTSMVGGAVPNQSGQQILISLKLMNRIIELDQANQTMTVEGGCILQVAQEMAQSKGFLFPLSLGSEGSCTLGGNLATNAGGTNVLRYGNAREQCLGLEVVNAQGQVINSLRSLRKDNTGYDLRHLFIGSEGTLGIITQAIFKLFPLPKTQWTALVSLDSIPKAIELLRICQQMGSGLLSGFEMMTRESLSLIELHFKQFKNPMAGDPNLIVLIELSDQESEAHARQIFENILEHALESNTITDAIVAENLTQVNHFWQMRDHITLAQAMEGGNIKHDITLPLSSMTHFITQTDAMLKKEFPGLRVINFGHLGDGNLHYNMSPPIGADFSEFVNNYESRISEIVYAQVDKYKGSISAEHGIGQSKAGVLKAHRGEQAYETMLSIKKALDPHNLMNPDRVVLVG
ncbi:MAG: FAD-binding oxidoreductase [Betaproteobacteria bacterium]